MHSTYRKLHAKKALRNPFFHIFAPDMRAEQIPTKIIVAFTGHRSYHNEADEALRDVVTSLYCEGARHFRIGMAQGFDLAAGEVVVELMNKHRNIVLEACIPYPTFAQYFSSEQRAQYDNIMSHATIIRYASDSYHTGVYNRRNNMLVEGATHLIAWWNGSRSGTEYTLRRARKQGCTTRNLFPNPQLTISI